MTDEHINEVINLYSKRETVKRKPFLPVLKISKKNDFNLNIPRYVDNFEKEEEVDLKRIVV